MAWSVNYCTFEKTSDGHLYKNDDVSCWLIKYEPFGLGRFAVFVCLFDSFSIRLKTANSDYPI